jgi:hypothetical protein
MHTFTHNRQDDDETEVVVEYTYHPGEPMFIDWRNGGGDPGCPPSVEIVRVTACGMEIEPTDAEIEAWETYALENHEDDGPDPDYLRDLRMEQKWERKYG